MQFWFVAVGCDCSCKDGQSCPVGTLSTFAQHNNQSAIRQLLVVVLVLLIPVAVLVG